MKMSLPYDGAIFERRKWNYAAIFKRRQWSEIVSQRFRNICYKFRGTFRLAAQITSVNFLLPTLPRSLAYVVLFTLILFSLFLCILIYFARNSNEDPDLLEAMRSGRKIGRNVGFGGVLTIIFLVAFFGIWILSIADKTIHEDDCLFIFIAFAGIVFLAIKTF